MENISNEQLIIDIKNTELEVQAYKNISDGFLTLSNLPETNEFMAREYYELSKKYDHFWVASSDFLGQLYLEQNKRNIRK